MYRRAIPLKQSTICIASLHKRRSRDVLRSVALGNGWGYQVRGSMHPEVRAVFYGVTTDTVGLLRQASEWLYMDNAYFGRGQYFRVTRNAVQHDGVGDSDGHRWRALGLSLAPWRPPGRHILVCPQSDQWHQWMMGAPLDVWVADVVHQLRQHTDRPIVIRRKPQIGREREADAVLEAERQLLEAFEDCHAVVVHQSGVGIQAALHGVPVFATGAGAVSPVACAALSKIETPLRPERLRWAQVLADNQWTWPEIHSGALRNHFGHWRRDHGRGASAAVGAESSGKSAHRRQARTDAIKRAVERAGLHRPAG